MHDRFVVEHGLQDCVSIRGQLPQAELAEEMRRSQAFVFPSLRGFGGGVILEAMACALPSLIVDYGGPAELGSDATARGVGGIVKDRDGRPGHEPGALPNDGRGRRRGSRCAYLGVAKASKIAAVYRQVLQANPLPLR